MSKDYNTAAYTRNNKITSVGKQVKHCTLYCTLFIEHPNNKNKTTSNLNY